MLALIKQLLTPHNTICDEFKDLAYVDLPLLAVDLELTDLNANAAKITSIGWVLAKRNQVDLSSAQYSVIRAKGDLKQSPVIHGLTAKDISQGEHIRTQLAELEQYARSHVWVLHNAALDMTVLHHLWDVLALPQVSVTTIDTMLLEIYAVEKKQGCVPSGSVMLANARGHYGLAQTPLHNALDDALATLTLLFAQLYSLDKTGNISLQALAHTKAIKQFTLGSK